MKQANGPDQPNQPEKPGQAAQYSPRRHLDLLLGMLMAAGAALVGFAIGRSWELTGLGLLAVLVGGLAFYLNRPG